MRNTFLSIHVRQYQRWRSSVSLLLDDFRHISFKTRSTNYWQRDSFTIPEKLSLPWLNNFSSKTESTKREQKFCQIELVLENLTTLIITQCNTRHLMKLITKMLVTNFMQMMLVRASLIFFHNLLLEGFCFYLK